MDYKMNRNIPVCLECGDKIRYGRTDKKFCCDECRNKHHNRIASRGRVYRRRVLATLDRNYSILNSLLNSGITSIDITEVLTMGFIVNAMTSYVNTRHHQVHCCFDIKYIITPTKITSISKLENVSLTLQNGSEIFEKHK